MQPNCVVLRRFKPVNISAEKCPVGRPKKKPVDQPFYNGLHTSNDRNFTLMLKLLKINYLIDRRACLQF